MKPVPNPNLVRFSDANAPAAWTSKQAKALFEAGLEAERDPETGAVSTEWCNYAVTGTVQVASQPQLPYVSPMGTAPSVAKRRVEHEIAGMRKLADQLEQKLRAYGPEAFIETWQPVSAPLHPFAAEEFLLGVVRRGATHVRVNGRLFKRDATGALRREATRVEPPAGTSN